MDPSRFRTEERLTQRERQLHTRLSYAQLIRNGITTGMPIAGDGLRAWAETYEEMADNAAIAEEMGIRMYLGPATGPILPATGGIRRTPGVPGALRRQSGFWRILVLEGGWFGPFFPLASC